MSHSLYKPKKYLVDSPKFLFGGDIATPMRSIDIRLGTEDPLAFLRRLPATGFGSDLDIGSPVVV